MLSAMCPLGHSAESARIPLGVRDVSALSRPDPTRPEYSAAAIFAVVAPITKSKIVELVDVREPRRLGLELAR